MSIYYWIAARLNSDVAEIHINLPVILIVSLLLLLWIPRAGRFILTPGYSCFSIRGEVE